MSNNKAKQAAGYAAAELVEEGMTVGLGTGSTAYFFIEKLIDRCKLGLRITAIATSKQSSEQAKAGNIELIEPDQLESLDIDVDGADEIDHQKQMIKGGGGALFREKIIASCAQEMIVVIDESKLVDQLGSHPLPIEISSFSYPSIIKKIQTLNLVGTLREEGHSLYITDNGNLIFDAHLKEHPQKLREIHDRLIQIPGVIETGFFGDMAGRVVIGYPDGHSEIKAVL